MKTPTCDNQRYLDDDRSGRQVPGDNEKAVHDAMPFDVHMYMSSYEHPLDATRFRALRFIGGRRLFVEVPELGTFNMAVHAWRERFRHWAGRGVELLAGLPHAVDMPFVHCEEERRYMPRVAELAAGAVRSGDVTPP